MDNEKSVVNWIDDDDHIMIDFSLLLDASSSSSRHEKELHKFRSALSSWGCFQLINHGIQAEFLNKMREKCKQFFGLTMEEKLKYAMLPGEANGYYDHTMITTSGKSSDDHHRHLIDHDWNERLSLIVYPQDRRQLNFWPHKPHEFKEMIHEYTMKLTTIFDILFKRVLNILDVDEEKFAQRYEKNKEINVGINFYPPCPSPEGVIGLKPHSDFSALTIVLQDEPGLQVLKDDQWFLVPAVPDALFVSIGDPIEIMSNGIFKSVVHRVVTSKEKSRLSVVMFWDSDRNCEIGPLDELISDTRPQLYKKISHKDYVTNFLGHYNSGQRPIESVKI